VTYNISVPLTGGATPQQGEMVASAIARAIKRRDPELMGQLDRWAGNTRRL
jgi:ribosomal protein S9